MVHRKFIQSPAESECAIEEPTEESVNVKITPLVVEARKVEDFQSKPINRMSVVRGMNGVREPTRAEIEEQEERRRRRDELSKRMGEYLLKGYKMLDAYCDTCGNILLEDRQSVRYCVHCNEIENEQQSSPPAANRVVELPLNSGDRPPSGKASGSGGSGKKLVSDADNAVAAAHNTPSKGQTTIHVVKKAQNVVQAKLTWATKQLNAPSTSLQDCILYTKLIADCAIALNELCRVSDECERRKHGAKQ